MHTTKYISVPLFCVRHQKIGGVESAVYNLVRGLASVGARLHIALGSEEFLSPEFTAWLGVSGSKVSRSHFRSVGIGTKYRFLEETRFALWARQRNNWIVWPNYFLPLGAVGGKAQNAVIIHDLQHRVFPQFYSSQRRRWLDACYQRAMLRADKLLFISQHELDLSLDIYGGAHAQRSSVIGNAIDWSRFSRKSEAGIHHCVPSGRYILTVCHQFPHKNVPVLIRAFAEIAIRHSDLRLCLVGTPSEAVLTTLHEPSVAAVRQRIEFTGFVSDEHLGELYRNASLFVLPSLYEGFGMPAIEAIAHRVPTLVSDGGALPEVTAGYARIGSASFTVAQWAETIEQALESPEEMKPDDAARAAVMNKYAPEIVAKRLLGVLDIDG